MPIYEFQCESCGHKKEILIIRKSDMKGSNKMGCDKCKGMYKKVMSAAHFNMKGFSEKNSYSHIRDAEKSVPVRDVADGNPNRQFKTRKRK